MNSISCGQGLTVCLLTFAIGISTTSTLKSKNVQTRELISTETLEKVFPNKIAEDRILKNFENHSPESIGVQNSKSKPLTITSKERPFYTQEARKNQTEGTITLRVVF